MGAFLALRAKNRAIRSRLHGEQQFCTAKLRPANSSKSPMRFLRDFRSYPGCMGEQRFCFAKSLPTPYAAWGQARLTVSKLREKLALGAQGAGRNPSGCCSPVQPGLQRKSFFAAKRQK
jgi:hypothetical protein